jgi:hypothetical protein
MVKNILDAVIPAEQLVTVDTAITSLETTLTILVGLTAEERRSLLGMGPQSESFAEQALLAGKQYVGLMPPDLDIQGIERDKALREALLPRFERLRTLTNKMEHTIQLAGTEYYAGGLAIYRALKAFGRAAGLDNLIAELGRRFARAKAEPAQPPPQQPAA